MKNSLAQRFSWWVTGAATSLIFGASAIATFTRKAPGQILAPIGVLICSILNLTIADDTIFDPILSVTQIVLVFIQFRSLFRTIKANRIRHAKEDKKHIQEFFDIARFQGIPSSIRFLSIYKDPWFRARYYTLRGITRLSLYRYGRTDIYGSHTKFQVNAKDLFHLQLKGCIDTEDPDKAVEGIDFIAKGFLTK